MQRTWLRFVPAPVLAAFLCLAVSGGTQVSSRDRIAIIDPSTVAPVRGTAHPVARGHFDQGRTNPATWLEGVTITFRLSVSQQADLDRLLQEQQDISSPNYHKWLTPEQYAARFGMSDADLAKVKAWLQSQRLRVGETSRTHTEVSFSGTVAQIERALHTQIHDYVVKGERHFANATDVAFPAAFAGAVVDVRNLNDFQPKPHYHPARPNFTSSVSGSHFLEPGDFAIIYKLTNLYSQGLDGTGQKIAVVGQTTLNLSDIQAFRTASGLPVNNPTFTQVPNTGTAMSCPNDVPEADLDVEWSGGVAPGAKILYYYAGVGTGRTCSNRTFNVFTALNYVIQNDVAPVVSISYGNCEANIGQSTANSFRQLIKTGNSFGQTVVAAAGDAGATDCDLSAPATRGLAVDIPAAIPEVTGVGGTEFNGDASACPGGTCTGGTAPGTQYWSGSSSLTSGPSALGYIPERVWNDTCFPNPSCTAGSTPGPLSAGGGGSSVFFARGSWQSGTGVPAGTQRAVPDISLSASADHDPYLFCTPPSKSGQLTDCTNGFRDSAGNLDAIGGTSAGAPTFSGIMAIINQATNSTMGQGNANQILYSLASGVNTGSSFNDITVGDNTVPCSKGTTGCPNGGNIGFTSGTGYDQASGLGSIDGFNLVTSWTGFVSGPNFTVTANPNSVSLSTGKSGTTTITVAGTNSFSGTVQLACSVPSTATSQLSCSLSPTSVSITAGTPSATSTLTLNSLGASGALHKPRNGFVLASLFGVAGMVFLAFPKERLRRRMLAFMLFGMVGLLPACGGGETPIPVQNKSASFSVTVNGTSGALSHGTTVNVTVQ